MKLIINSSNNQTAHVDVITSEKGILNTYEDEAAFWSSQAPISTADITPSADYDTLTIQALGMLGDGWAIKDTEE